jgi:AcrR family transcriptional regulator
VGRAFSFLDPLLAFLLAVHRPVDPYPLTHGGFYAHFESREGMLAEAADRARADGMALLSRVAATAPPERALEAMLRAYLSKERVEGVETGCAIAALGSEMPREAGQDGGLRHSLRRLASRRRAARASSTLG